MQTKRYLQIVVKLRRVSAGLPRRKVCVRSVHHIFRPAASDQEASDEADCEDDRKLSSPASSLLPEVHLV